MQLREVLVVDSDTTLELDDYPWLVEVRAVLKGGDAAGDDGSPGEDGYVLLELYGPDED